MRFLSALMYRAQDPLKYWNAYQCYDEHVVTVREHSSGCSMYIGFTECRAIRGCDHQAWW